jgi:dipeptide/tripeptide permease
MMESGIVFQLALAQQQTYVVIQATQSNRHLWKNGFEVLATSYGVFSILAIAMCIPIYDRVVVPFFRKLTGKKGGITHLQRIGIIIFLSILTIVISSLVEVQRRSLGQDPIMIKIYGRAMSSMSGLWLIPQLALSGLCEAFSNIGQIELYYMEFIENMKSLSGAFFSFSMGLSSFLSGILISTIHKISLRARTGDWLPEDLNRGRLEYLYYMIAALKVLNFGYFLVYAKWYRYKGDARI